MPDQLRGWATWKDGAPHDLSLHPSKRDLLIGYDLMPLRGLRRTERVMASQGITVCRSRVSRCGDQQRHGYCLAIAGKLDAASMSWSITHKGGGVWNVEDSQGHWALSFWSCCGYVADLQQVSISEAERKVLSRLDWFDLDYSDPRLPRDKRRRATLDVLWAEASKIFARHSLEIVPVKLAQEVANA